MSSDKRDVWMKGHHHRRYDPARRHAGVSDDREDHAERSSVHLPVCRPSDEIDKVYREVNLMLDQIA
jgi:hypothetical protein